MKAYKSYKFRLYPNTEQQKMFNKTFGCVRFVYNKMLADKIEHYKATGEILKNTSAQLKNEFEWLCEVDSMALHNAQRQLETAYKNFLRDKSIDFPKFRRKHSGRQSYTTNLINENISTGDGFLKLPKVGKVRVSPHRAVPDGYAIKSVTISREPTGEYYASILTEHEAEPVDEPVGNALGLDYSSPHFYVDSNGEEADMPHFCKAAKKLARELRRLSRKVKGSNNYHEQKIKVARAYEEVCNCHKDWQHKKSKELADRYDLICNSAAQKA